MGMCACCAFAGHRVVHHDLIRSESLPVRAPVGPALGYWVKEGVGLVVHFPLEDVAKINTP